MNELEKKRVEDWNAEILEVFGQLTEDQQQAAVLLLSILTSGQREG